MQLATNVFALIGIIPRGISLSRIKDISHPEFRSAH